MTAVDRALRMVPLALTIVAEAAWIAVLGALIAEFEVRPPILGIAPLAVFVAAGIAASVARRPLGRRWPYAALGLALLGGIVGSLGPVIGAGLGAGAVATPALSGSVAGVAILRGYAHADDRRDPSRLDRLLVGGLTAIALMAILGGLVASPVRPAFQAETTADGVIFAVSAILAIALTRVAAASQGVGVAWPRNRAWLGMLLAAVAAIVILSIRFSSAVGPAIELVVGVGIVPLIVLGLIAGWGRRTAILIGRVVLVGAVFLLVIIAFGGQGPRNPQSQNLPGVPPDQTQTTAADPVIFLALGVLLVLGLIAVLLLIRSWMRPVEERNDDDLDTRTIDRGESLGPSRRRRRRRWFVDAPRDAVAAYLRLLEDLEGRRSVERIPAETPAEHAGRLRNDGRGSLGLDLLAADYGLARFGARSLSAAEDGRAVGRWRRLRSRLRAEPGPSAQQVGPTLGDDRPGSAGHDDDLPPRGGAGDDRDG